MILLALFSIQVWYFYSAMFWAKVFSLLFVFFAEHSEDKQFPVHPAAGYSSRVCHHPQLTPTGPGLLRHDHLLQSCWWVWTRSPPSQTDNNLFGRDYLHNTLLVPALFSVAHSVVTEMRVSSQCAWLLFFFFFLTEYSLSSAEISSLQGFSSPGLSLGSMSAWQQHQLGQAALNSLVWVTHLQTKAHSPDALT